MPPGGDVLPGGDVPLPQGLAIPVRVATDPEAFGGPLVGLLAGAQRATWPALLVVGGDMPSLVPAVMTLMLERLASGDADAILLSRDRPLPMAIRRTAALVEIPALLAAGTRSLRSLVEKISGTVLPEATWRAADASAASLMDVDRPEDLDRVKPAV